MNNNNKKLITHFLAILSFLMILPGVANASPGDAVTNAQNFLTSIFDIDVKLYGAERDYVQSWIYMLYGDFVFAPWDSSFEQSNNITLLARAVGFSSLLAMLLGLIIVYYVMIGGALNTAYSGQALGKQWSSNWVPIRTGLGFFLIMPMKSIGGGVLSVIQVFALWAILIGSNAGNVLWTYATTYVMSPESNTGYVSVGIKPSSDILNMLMCSENIIRYNFISKGASEIALRDSLVAYTISSRLNSGTGNAMINSQTGDNIMQSAHSTILDVPDDQSFVGSPTDLEQMIKNDGVKIVRFGRNGICGSISFGNSDSDAEDTNSIGDANNVSDLKLEATRNAIKEGRKHVAELVGKHQRLMDKIYQSNMLKVSKASELQSGDGFDQYEDIQDEFYESTKVFADNLNDAIRTSITNNQAMKDFWKDDIQKGGWPKAGLWFYEISSILNMSQNATNAVTGNIRSSTPSYCVAPDDDSIISSFLNLFGSDDEVCEESLGNYSRGQILVSNLLSDSIKQAISNNEGPLIVSGEENVASCQKATECSFDNNVTNDIFVDFSKGIINALADGQPAETDSMGADGSRNSLTSPFQTVSSIGHSLNEMAAAVMGVGLVASGVSSQLTQAPLGVLAFGGGMLDYIVSGITSLLMLTLSTGFVLAYLIPFLPVITWVLMMTGYLLTIVEATIAAPLAVILMVTPEGEGIAGTRLERALQLLSMAILKPSLMVIGVITSVSVGGVGYMILNEFFFKAASYVLSGSIFDFLAIVVIYTLTAFELCKYSISIMHKLPDQILEWFSGGVGRPFGENEISSSISHGAGGATQGLGSVSSSMMSGAKDKLSGKRKAAQRHRERKDRKAK